MFFLPLFKGSSWLPSILIITLGPATLEPVHNITFLSYCFPLLWEHQKILQSAPSFKMDLDTIFATDGFVAFTQTLWIRYHYVTFCTCFGWCCFHLGFFCFLFFYLHVFVILYQWPTLSIYIERGPLEDVSVLFLAAWDLNTLLSPHAWGC